MLYIGIYAGLTIFAPAILVFVLWFYIIGLIGGMIYGQFGLLFNNEEIGSRIANNPKHIAIGVVLIILPFISAVLKYR